MPRLRGLSFMSQFGGGKLSTPESPADSSKHPSSPSPMHDRGSSRMRPGNIDTSSPHNLPPKLDANAPPSPHSPGTPSRARGDSRVARPNSMMQPYQPPQMDVSTDTPPELQPIFSYLNSHSNKLYQEGYFLKLHDLDSRGRPSHDRVWNECFAQLVGTVLSLWDAAALDAAGADGEVVPTFINLSDASIKMIESLAMNGAQGGSLQNVLSISTAANNRYLLHFNSLNSLTQWTAGIRLAMFEHSTLQEAYTGSLIAGKGRYLNNIKQIMERSKFAHDDWARVRFGAGTPWRRCWCVISPPDEKEWAKAQKNMKKSSSYGRAPVPKGDIKFYDTRKVTKKTRPIATITDAFAAYAIYPQSKPLIDQSTLVKLEGLVTIHSSPETTTEGFVFVMPEVHPAVSGFEMMLRWLFRVFDTFALYGRPNKLIADVLDQRGLMFAMPRDRRYGYMDILDVSGLIHTFGSQNWSERQWRKEMKKLTSTRMTSSNEGSPPSSRSASQRRNTTSRTSLPPNRGLGFEEGESAHSSPGSRSGSPVQAPGMDRFVPSRRTDSAPPSAGQYGPHKRSVSDALGYRKHMAETPSRLSYETSRVDDYDDAPPPPQHGGPLGRAYGQTSQQHHRNFSSDQVSIMSPEYEQIAQQAPPTPYHQPPEPVISPPAFTHSANSRPANQPYQAPELRRAHSNVDAATLYQMREAARPDRPEDADEGYDQEPMPYQLQQGAQMPYPQQNTNTATLPYRQQLGVPADRSQGSMNLTQGAYANNHQQQPQQHPEQQRDLRRLSTIPGSPFVGEGGEYFESPKQSLLPHLDGVLESPSPSLRGDRPPLVPLHSSASVTRKPVPKTSAAAPTDQVRAASPSPPRGSFTGALVDSAVLERLLNYDPDEAEDARRAGTPASGASSVPEYASTVASAEEAEREKEKPRAGRLKTVGDPGMSGYDARKGRWDGSGGSELATRERDAAHELPKVDFGPTYSYKPTVRPLTAGGGEAGYERLSLYFDAETPPEQRVVGEQPPTSNLSYDRLPLSYYYGQAGQGEEAEREGKRRSVAWSPPLAGGVSPGRASPGDAFPQGRVALTPEQWVQYRAAVASVPQPAPQPAPPRRAPPAQQQRPGLQPRTGSGSSGHLRTQSGSSAQQLRQAGAERTPSPLAAHQRTSSSGSVLQLRQATDRAGSPLARTPSGDWTQAQAQRGAMSKTPPLLPRTGSGDWTQAAAGARRTPPPFSRTPSGDWTHARTHSRTPPARPLSRGTSAYFAQGPGALTAQEQMYVARATGTPLVTLAPSQSRKMPDASEPTLINALAAREREKAEFKEGVRSGLVHNAIAAREQQARVEAEERYRVQMLGQQARVGAEERYRVQMLGQQQQQQYPPPPQQQVFYPAEAPGFGQVMYQQAVAAPDGHLQQQSPRSQGDWRTRFGPGLQQQQQQQQALAHQQHGFQQPVSPGGQQRMYSPGYGAQQQGGRGQGAQWEGRR